MYSCGKHEIFYQWATEDDAKLAESVFLFVPWEK